MQLEQVILHDLLIFSTAKTAQVETYSYKMNLICYNTIMFFWLSMAQFIFPLSFNFKVQRKDSFFIFRVSNHERRMEKRMDGVRSRAVCVSGTNFYLTSLLEWWSALLPSFLPFCCFKCHDHSRLSVLRAKYGVHRCVIPPYKASSVCSEESLSFQMSQWSALVTVTPCLLTSD